ncbi:hypothetical protein [Streptomyces coeruleorubidus]|uniref:hypothetical protein n=1 Tax=Streptomyces coeruleorubidus TaxID=116188 RepID=UPI0033C69E7A
MKDGDAPTVVAEAIVTAAIDKKPKPRYPAGQSASRVTTARRLVPDQQGNTPAGTGHRHRPAGLIRLVTGGLPNIDDFSFLTPRSDVVFAAQNGSSSQNGPDRVLVIYPDGTYKPVLTSADGLASPSATAVRGDRLYITGRRPRAPRPETADRQHQLPGSPCRRGPLT